MAKEKEVKPIGEVTHFYKNIGVAVVSFSKTTRVGDTVHFKGATTDFTQKIDGMQFDHKDVDKAAKGKEVGIKVDERVRTGDKIFPVV